MGTARKFSEGDVILDENMRIRAIPVVTKGSVRVIRRDEDGRELLLYNIRSGESCIMSLLGGLHNDTSKVVAVAEEDTDVLFIPIDQVSALIRENPEWLNYIFRLYHKRFEELLEVVNAVAFKKVDERLLDFIKKKCAMTNSRTLLVTHDQLAHELGTARVVVSRLLKRMEEEGIVNLGRNKITLV
ncbi:MAG: Crp/Fnr family transcriptional regulator [Cyclobacteriaceae bacterium]|nr:Crp/Fnr family transcriptional regulator [Cyclobacteriaceae bacterium]